MSDLRRVVARELGPVLGAGRRALRRHPVWAETADGAGVGVVVVPGFGGVDASLADMRRWLARPFARAVLRALVGLAAAGVPGLLGADCLHGACRDATAAGLAAPLRTPAVAVYSRNDGVVGWRSCLDPAAEWVEVRSSHTGMGTDPQVYAELARRLAEWSRCGRVGP